MLLPFFIMRQRGIRFINFTKLTMDAFYNSFVGNHLQVVNFENKPENKPENKHKKLFFNKQLQIMDEEIKAKKYINSRMGFIYHAYMISKDINYVPTKRHKAWVNQAPEKNLPWFDVNGIKIQALNKKNAIRKYKNLIEK